MIVIGKLKKQFQNSKTILGVFLVINLLITFSLLGYHLTSKFWTRTSSTGSLDTAAGNTAGLTENAATPTKAQTVCIDPGHGGDDTGAIYGNIFESKINLTVALAVKTILENDGYQVFMTRTDDTTVGKRDRAYFCNSKKATVMVSIHHNSYQSDKSVDYGTALYFKDTDQLLAASILNSTSGILGVKNQGISKFDNSLLWVAEMPAALSEGFFMTNTAEYRSLQSASSHLLTDEAFGIASGIVNYFEYPDQIKTSLSDGSLIIDRTDLGD